MYEDKDSLVVQQIKLEQEMTNLGQIQYERRTLKARTSGAEGNTAPAKELIAKHVESVAKGIKSWIDDSLAGKAGRRAQFAKLAKILPADVCAFIALKCLMNSLTFTQTFGKLALEIGSRIEDEARCRNIRKEMGGYYKYLIDQAKDRVSYDRKSFLIKHNSEQMGVEWQSWKLNERVQVGAKCIEAIIENTAMFEIIKQVNGKNRTDNYVRPTLQITDWVDKRNGFLSLMQPRFEPMVVPPLPWTGVYGGGYLSREVRRLPLVKTRLKGYLEEMRHHEMPIVYAAINAMQDVAWKVNSPLLNVMNTLWEQSAEWAPFPQREPLGLPLCPICGGTVDATKKNHTCFQADHDSYSKDKHKTWRRDAKIIYTRNVQSQSKRMQIQMCLNTAEKYGAYEQIYFPYQLDFRGRVYAVPSFTPQGPDHMKALLVFSEGKPLGEHGEKWLAIHGANIAGVDKVSFQERYDWVIKNEQQIRNIVTDPFSNRGWVSGQWFNAADELEERAIDKPWQFLAFCYEWTGAMENGTEFISHLPIELDGSCSGIQNYSMAFRDEVGGAAVNLLPSDKPQDIYQRVADRVSEIAQAATGEERGIADQWLKFGISRKITKRPVMTYPYGSNTFGFKHQLMEDIIRPAKNLPNFPFDGDGMEAAGWMAKTISQALPEIVVKAAEGMNWLRDTARLLASQNLPVIWHTPTNFMVLQASRNVKPIRVATAISGSIIRSQFQQDVEKLDRVKQVNGISPNFIHSMDASHLMLTVVRAGQAGINNMKLVHDSFATHAGDTEELFWIVREALVEMYTQCDVFQQFKDEALTHLPPKLHDKVKPLPLKGSLDLELVKDSLYAFA